MNVKVTDHGSPTPAMFAPEVFKPYVTIDLHRATVGRVERVRERMLPARGFAPDNPYRRLWVLGPRLTRRLFHESSRWPASRLRRQSGASTYFGSWDWRIVGGCV